ncbi:alpha-2-macroglobulin-like isoform X2 [Labeo rohita]|uniref:Alpha-2-macroglobulin-like isoform X2 n=1 Tax=Labeo rohita TaxID=84645 RepID=A0A498LSJ6_LABRO|nr:alpha-2-macroglobulin-like isoform X2 [Labeo rohita]
MTVSLLDDKNTATQLVQQRSRMVLHRCFSFRAPQADAESVQKLQVVVQGRSFKMTEERKVMFKPYLPLTFIQTDKPIYNPGQTVNFRVVTMDAKFVPLVQMYNLVVVEDNHHIQIGQWTNVSSTGWILELSHDLNPEAQAGLYTLRALIGDQMVSQVFEVKKYVLPKFDITITAPQMYSVGDVGLKVEVCGKYTYGQPVPGQVFIEVSRDLFPYIVVPEVTRLCLNKTAKASATPQVVYGHKSPYFSTDTRVIPLFQTATPDSQMFSELTIEKLEQPLKCGTAYPVTIKYSFFGETGDYSADIIYMVLSRGVIVLHGFEKVQAKDSDMVTSGTVSFELSVGVNMAPVVQILTYCVLPSENVVVASVAFDTKMCFHNQVSLRFSPATAVPGEGNVLTVSAQAGSLCGLSAVDQSVLIMESGRRLSAEAMFNLLPVRSLSDYPLGVEDEQECLNVRPRRTVPTDQAYEALKSVGMKIATNLPVREPQCLTYRGLNYYRSFHDVMYLHRPVAFGMAEMAPAAVAESGGKSGSSSDVTVRTYFPETWIWQLAQVGDSGSTQVPLKVPDTITTWETEAFCLSSKGLGLAPPALLTVFQPFFLELSLPYSIVRGEFFELKATVFNYLSKCIMVHVTPAWSPAFILGSFDPYPYPYPYPSCICANGRKTFKWVFMSVVLGNVNVTVRAQAVQAHALCGNETVSVPEKKRIDVVTRSLLVLAEGVERTTTQSWLLCPKESVVSEDVTLTLPTDVIQGSVRCSVSVLGDIMGRALKNLDGLLKMPSGCGEQNMMVLAPNIYILQYLEVTAQLTAAIRATATGYLQSGYQGQLNYRHGDGSYSTFGYDAANTWLTAFVLRSFGLARNFIYVDPNVLQSAKDWLISKQGSDGCFMQQGTLYHNDMKGGVGDDVTVTAYIAASLLELGIPVTDPVVTSALSCLRSSVGNLGNTYATALLAYTFSLAGETSTRSQLLTTLDNRAISEGAKLHWSQTASGDTLAVEISSYVLLAVLAVQPLTTAHLGYANRIVNWLVGQQNPYGGFSSTQDTVVALHALSLYATRVFSLTGSSNITVQSLLAGGEVYDFSVTRNNRLLYQEKPLKNVPGKYSVKVKGSCCVSVQVVCFYNIPTPIKVARTLSVEVKVTGDCRRLGANLMLNFTVKYGGPKASTNMVIVDVKLLSGFTADTSLLGTPPNVYVPLVERVDAQDDHVLVYLREVPKGVPMTYKLQLKQVIDVHSLRPAVINVYDYYQTSDQFETTYMSPCK